MISPTSVALPSDAKANLSITFMVGPVGNAGSNPPEVYPLLTLGEGLGDGDDPVGSSNTGPDNCTPPEIIIAIEISSNISYLSVSGESGLPSIFNNSFLS